MARKWFLIDLWPQGANQRFVDQFFAEDEEQALDLFDERHPQFLHETLIGVGSTHLEPLKQSECGWQPQIVGS
jgi:hypothetical protein